MIQKNNFFQPIEDQAFLPPPKKLFRKHLHNGFQRLPLHSLLAKRGILEPERAFKESGEIVP
ncbi:MAG: hypothetical protein ACKVOQ_06520, partial [Cyclobacteriaceae bacterium]